MNIIEVFKTVRDIPYRIPLALGEKDECCNSKHKVLKDLLVKQGFECRYRMGSFLWGSFDLPDTVLSVHHDDLGSHVWLEILIEGKWVTVDATWDAGLKKIFHVNEWDGKSHTETAVKPLKIFTPQKSEKIMNNESEEGALSDLKINGEFYKAFNNWLEEQRASVSE